MMPDRTTRLWMYEAMFKSRCFEEQLAAVYLEGKRPRFDVAQGILPGELHLSNGQEPCAVGVVAHLRAGDWCGASHRSHHIAVACGVSGEAMTAEMFGKQSGLCGGYGGHMHLFDAGRKFSSGSIVAAGLPLALGAALSFRLRKLPSVAVAFIGEGAANQGAFHETLNLAGLWKLPLITVIEDNSWGVSVSKRESTAVESNALRAAGYAMPGSRVTGNDPCAIYEAAGEAIERARRGGGPALLELETLRLEGHFVGDVEQYRPQSERDARAAQDPIPAFRERLLREGAANDEALRRLESAVRAEIERWIDHARAAPYPAPEAALRLGGLA